MNLWLKITISWLILSYATATAGVYTLTGANDLKITTSRVAFINGSINEQQYTIFQKQMLETSQAPGDRLIVIDSRGGEVNAGQGMIEMIEAEKSLGIKVYCFVTSRAMSMAFNILTHCNVRLASNKARLLFHKIAYASLDENSGRLTPNRLRELAAQLDSDDNKYASRNAKALNMPTEDYTLFAYRDTVWMPQALVNMGYLQGIATLIRK